MLLDLLIEFLEGQELNFKGLLHIFVDLPIGGTDMLHLLLGFGGQNEFLHVLELSLGLRENLLELLSLLLLWRLRFGLLLLVCEDHLLLLLLLELLLLLLFDELVLDFLRLLVDDFDDGFVEFVL